MIDPEAPDFGNPPGGPRRPVFGYRPASADAPPCVSIVTPYYNTGAVFHETAATVFGQSLQQWEWIIVNDGSTDRTQEIVDQPEFNEVVKVQFPQNRGYGAAIKAGWQATDADLVGFIDGDGTCDPDFAVKLVNRLTEAEADVVLAGRLNPESEMPLIRKIGNIIFARLLGLVSGKDLTDSASGFRIVREYFIDSKPDAITLEGEREQLTKAQVEAMFSGGGA